MRLAIESAGIQFINVIQISILKTRLLERRTYLRTKSGIMNRNFYWITVFLLALSACGDQVQPMHDDIMVIHDAVMPRMGEMHQLRVSLEDRMKDLDSLAALPYHQAILDLRSGEEMMWTWMNEYRKPEESSPESIDYLRSEHSKISEVANQMTTSIDRANKLLQ